MTGNSVSTLYATLMFWLAYVMKLTAAERVLATSSLTHLNVSKELHQDYASFQRQEKDCLPLVHE
jgi:head-tail adaptor